VLPEAEWELEPELELELEPESGPEPELEPELVPELELELELEPDSDPEPEPDSDPEPEPEPPPPRSSWSSPSSGVQSWLIPSTAKTAIVRPVTTSISSPKLNSCATPPDRIVPVWGRCSQLVEIESLSCRRSA